ncbi:hypothetical protein [Mycoplasma todarodis]|uniref:RNA polymerase sigma-70 region 2 domain-containing protein n=1 Tax=Mycoplasma todarodis TaxID=1937191 RepID=A0A4R0XUI1_9MOLU|nr:hypothetical protein [Mycoplasma todarodis]TCG10531.1 hypothetical protein C4B25_03820 [Mycoplasma todarodis]
MLSKEIENLKKMSNTEIINKMLLDYNEAFDLVIANNQWSFSATPLEKEDVKNIFLSRIPTFIAEYNPEYNLKLKTFLCIRLKHVIFNESRKHNTHKYKVLNQRTQLLDRKYSVKCFSLPDTESHLDFSVLKPFEYSVYLSLFEACKSISFVAREHNVSRYIVERALIEIKRKIKKQLQ